MVVSSLMLMVVLVIGAAGYVGARATFRGAAFSAVAPLAQARDRIANPDRVATPAAVALAVVAALLLGIATTHSRTGTVEARPHAYIDAD